MFSTSTIAAYGPTSSLSSLPCGLQLSQGFLEENIVEEDKDEIGEAGKPKWLGGRFESLQYIEDMHLTISSESLSGELKLLSRQEAAR